MLREHTPVLEEDIDPLVSRLSGILCLHHWRIKHKVVPDSDLGDSLMEIRPLRDRNMATIYMRQSLIGETTSEFGPLLLHELMHLVLDPIVEEHTFQLQYEVSQPRLKEYQRRFLRPLEKVVEHLTHQVAPLINFCDVVETVNATADRLSQVEDYATKFYSLTYENHDLLMEIVKFMERRSEAPLPFAGAERRKALLSAEEPDNVQCNHDADQS